MWYHWHKEHTDHIRITSCWIRGYEGFITFTILHLMPSSLSVVQWAAISAQSHPLLYPLRCCPFPVQCRSRFIRLIRLYTGWLCVLHLQKEFEDLRTEHHFSGSFKRLGGGILTRGGLWLLQVERECEEVVTGGKICWRFEGGYWEFEDYTMRGKWTPKKISVIGTMPINKNHNINFTFWGHCFFENFKNLFLNSFLVLGS